MMAAMVELFRDSFDPGVPRRILLDPTTTPRIGFCWRPTQLALFNADHGSRCFLPIHDPRGDDRQASGRHPASRQDAGRGRRWQRLVLRHVVGRIPRPLSQRSRSWCAAIVITAGQRRWLGASASASATSSAWPAIRCYCDGSASLAGMPPWARLARRRKRSAATVISSAPPKAGMLEAPRHRPRRGRSTQGRRQPVYRHPICQACPRRSVTRSIALRGRGRARSRLPHKPPRLRPHAPPQGHCQPVSADDPRCSVIGCC